jgi:3-methyladenine DNA glycosylase AlkD
MLYPAYIERLKKWTMSENRWVQRASAVSLIIPAKKGLFRNDIFSIADALMDSKDDMVQKGYGWLLKECSKVYRDEVYRFVMKRKGQMPRTAFRYAIEKLPKEMRDTAMKRE